MSKISVNPGITRAYDMPGSIIRQAFEGAMKALEGCGDAIHLVEVIIIDSNSCVYTSSRQLWIRVVMNDNKVKVEGSFSGNADLLSVEKFVMDGVHNEITTYINRRLSDLEGQKSEFERKLKGCSILK